MKVAQFESSNGSFVGVEVDGKWIDYSKALISYHLLDHGHLMEPFGTITELLQFGAFDVAEMKKVVRHITANHLQKYFLTPHNAVLKAPIARPPKIVALGLNYVLHAKEGNFEVPKEPIIFVKVGSSVIGPNETISDPSRIGTNGS